MLALRKSNYDATARGPDERRRGPRGVRAVLVGVLTAATLAIAAPGAWAQAWSCDSFGYLFQTQSGDTFSSIVQVDLATGEQNRIGRTPTGTLNAVGFNPVDDFFYGMHADATTGLTVIGRIHSDGTVDDLPVATGPGGTMDPTAGTAIGDVGADGHYWVTSGSGGPGSTWYEVDLTTPTPTVLRSGPITLPPTLSSLGADWVFINGALYSVGNDPTDTVHHLVRFDTATGTFADLGALPAPFPNGTNGNIGAVFTDAAGHLYASANATNTVYRIDPTTHQVIVSAPPPPGVPMSPGNDGARCALAPVPTITVTKTVAGRVRPADQFTVGVQRPDGSVADTATTTGAQTTASTVDVPASQGKTFTITDAMAPGSPTPPGEYIKSIVCKDANGNTVPVGGSGPTWTLLVAATTYTCNVTNTAQADLEFVKTASPTPVVPGTNETYALTVTDHGPSTATNVSVSDPLPGGLTFVSASPGCGAAGKTVTCTAAEVAPGTSQTFTVTTKVASSATGCDGPNGIGNTATATSSVSDPSMGNNSSSVCPPIEPKVGLVLAKTPSATQVPAGGQVMYTLVVKNSGPSDASNVKVTDPMAGGLSLVAAKPSQGTCSTAGGQVSCTLGSLKADGSAQVLVTAQVSATPGCITNGSTVTSGKSSANASATICVQPGPEPHFDLATTKKANHGTVYVGQKTTYTILVTNNGPDAAPNAKVTDTFSVQASVVSVKTTQGTCTKANPLTCQLGTVAAGAKVTITVVIKPRRSGSARNAASATGEGADTNPPNNLARTTTKVKKVALRLSKVASRSSVHAGQKIGYRIRVRNPTKGEARDVRVCDRLPSGLRFVSSKPKSKRQGRQRCWTIKTLSAGKSRTFRVTVRAAKGANGRKTNSAVLSSRDALTRRAHDPVRVLGVATPVTG